MSEKELTHTEFLELKDPETQYNILKELTKSEGGQEALEQFCVILHMNKVQVQPALDALCRLPFKDKQ